MNRSYLRPGRVIVLSVVLLASPARSFAAQGDCSQPISNGSIPAATDCLFILQVSVFTASCDPDPCVCAPKGSLPVAATDALICLALATAQQVPADCPCIVQCDDAEVPTCGGECGPGDVCAPDPFEPDECTCLNPCEASSAPVCGASCQDEGPDVVCSSIGFSTAGGPVEDLCTCLPSDIQFCTDATAPDCEGVCQFGSVCGPAGGGSCACVAQPVQGPCTGATAPQCAGTCPDGFICQDTGGTCDCVTFTDQQETCFEAGAPACGGTCAFGEICAVGFVDDCECVSPCELGDAPACNGACVDDGESCVMRTVSVAGSSLDFCECTSAP